MTEDKLKWFKDAKFGMFIHWGLYAVPGGLWKGREMEYIGEWLQAKFRIPNAEYAKLAEQFNPTKFDAEEWVLTAKAAGMRYIVYTAKHHEGFSMYRSRVSPFNIYDAAPFKRDPLAELAKACEKHGLRLGLYYSQDLDWHEPDGGDPGPDFQKNFGMTWGNDWDFPDCAAKRFNRYFEGKVLPQLTELLSNYGRIATLWFDCPVSIGKAQSERIVELVRELQPDCLVNTRIGNGLGDYGSLGDNQMPSAKQDGVCESPGTLNDTWGFKVNDHNWKPANEIIELLANLAGKGANYLLNIGPQPDGRFPAEATAILKETGRWLDKCGAAIYGSSGNPFPYDFDWGFATVVKGSAKSPAKLNMIFKNVPKGDFKIAGLKDKPLRCYELSRPELELPFHLDGSSGIEVLTIELGSRLQGETLPALCVELDAKGCPEADQRLLPQSGSLRLAACKGLLNHGEAAAAEDGGRGVGAAGELQIASAHSLLDSSGRIVEWHNPADSVSWEIVFPEEGSYAVEVVTSSRWHSLPWSSGQTLQFSYKDQFGTRRWESKLNGKTKASAGSRCYEEGSAPAGELSARKGSAGVLSLRMSALGDAKNINMALKELRLAKQ